MVREDLVQADLCTPADKHAAAPFRRKAVLESDHTYRVTVLYADGRPRMTGRYVDAALTIPDGLFTYYYPNGNIESTGSYVHGVKAGTWTCATPKGEPRADRIYSGLDWDNLQVVVGVSERAPTLGGQAESVPEWEGHVQ
jgi:hypothetical protein